MLNNRLPWLEGGYFFVFIKAKYANNAKKAIKANILFMLDIKSKFISFTPLEA